MGGFNPKLQEFKDKHHNLTLLGLGWAIYWRFALIILAVEFVLFAFVFLVMASVGMSFQHDRYERMHGMQPMGKLNINVVCEGALAYMTFPDAASADAFVEECKAGEHPEIIERYKAQMNLGDGAQL